MGEDISHKTVVVLVILTLAVSIIGSLAVMNELAAVKPVKVGGDSSSGVVKLKVSEPSEPKSDDDGGSVQLRIMEPSP